MNRDFDLLARQARLARLEAAFTEAGGRGVALADEIDQLQQEIVEDAISHVENFLNYAHPDEELAAALRVVLDLAAAADITVDAGLTEQVALTAARGARS